MTIQVAVTLPDELVAELDRLVAAGSFASRSQAIRSGLETVVAGHHREQIDLGYREAMTRLPETDEEIAEATRLAIDSINDEPWERWW